jgi:hypothetical protein
MQISAGRGFQRMIPSLLCPARSQQNPTSSSKVPYVAKTLQ